MNQEGLTNDDHAFSAEFSLGPLNHQPRTEKTVAEVWRTLFQIIFTQNTSFVGNDMANVFNIRYSLVIIHTRKEFDTGNGVIKQNYRYDLLSVNTSWRIGPFSVHTTFKNNQLSISIKQVVLRNV